MPDQPKPFSGPRPYKQGPKSQTSVPPIILVLCTIGSFIPLLGAFLGIGLIIAYIASYRNKFLLIIGIWGIVFTSGVYGSLFYFTQHTSRFSKGFGLNKITQQHLKELAGQVEGYKVSNGNYPQSLLDINYAGQPVDVQDFEQTFNGKRIVYYFYQLKGDRYYPYSMGPDNKPFTKDDIFPKYSAKDTIPSGLILK